MSLFGELKRRNVLRVGTAYIVTAWLLIQVADTILPLFGFGTEAARLVVVALAIGLIPVLILSWAFELTPDGLRRESESEAGKPVAPMKGKVLDRLIMVVLALAVGYFAFDKFVLDPKRDATLSESAAQAGAEQAREEARLDLFNDKSVAVLPFANRSEEKEDEYFTDGMHDELLTRLSRISELKVISRTSVMRYRDTLMSIPDIAKELSVATILEGGVQRAGNQVRINVQLIDARTDEHLWAEIYDRELTAENLFAIQSEISETIAKSLHATLSPEERIRVFDLPTASTEAYEHYLRGRQLLATRNAADISNALREFEMAVAIDPDFALGWVGVADAIHLSPTGSRSELRETHRVAAERALQIDNELGEAYTSLASYYDETNQIEKAEAAYLKAIELNPNYAQAYHWYSMMIDGRLEGEKKLGLLYKAAQLDPLSYVIQLNIGGTLRALEREQDALEHYQELLGRHPEYASTYAAIASIHFSNFRIADAVRWQRQAIERDPENPRRLFALGRFYQPLGEVGKIATIVDEMLERFGPNDVLTRFLESQLRVMEVDWERQVSSGDPPDFNSDEARRLNSTSWQKAIDLIEALPPEPARVPVIQYMRLFSYAMKSEFQTALALYLDHQPEWATPERWPYMLTEGRYAWGEPCLLAGIMIGAGQDELGQALLQEIKNTQDQKFLWNVNPAICHLVGGEYEQALAWFEKKASDRRYVEWERFGSYPWWEPVKNDPRFLAVWKTNMEMMAEQRELFRQADKETARGQ